MLKYYVYHSPKHEYNKTISSIKEACGIDDVILLPEKSYLLRIPVMQQYEGYALVLSSSLLLKEALDVDSFNFDGKIGICNKKQTAFLIDCSCDYAKQILTNQKMVASPMRSVDVYELDLLTSDELSEYVITKENEQSVFLGEIKNKEV